GHIYVPMVTTRGCPYRCTYCGGPLNNGHRLRRRSAEHVIEEMRRLKAEYGVTMVSIVDDNFTMHPAHAREVLTMLIESGLGLAWRAPNGIRLDTLDRELVELMERSGCKELYLGVESGSPRVLDDMKRRVTVETYREKVALLARYSRIRLLGFFMLGYPTETEADAKMTVDLACELPLHRAAFFFFTPHPGTEIYDEMRGRGEIGDDIWDSLFYDKPTLGSRHIPLRRLRAIQRHAYVLFYARPRIVRHLMSLARGPRQFARLARKIAGTALGV
ncbi:MAG: radical SAM protein, partial [Deltaproteobacteria bacterium]|nr:radical SAM protein [Deltaproteobacteria bacterium]